MALTIYPIFLGVVFVILAIGAVSYALIHQGQQEDERKHQRELEMLNAGFIRVPIQRVAHDDGEQILESVMEWRRDTMYKEPERIIPPFRVDANTVAVPDDGLTSDTTPHDDPDDKFPIHHVVVNLTVKGIEERHDVRSFVEQTLDMPGVYVDACHITRDGD